MGWNFTLRVVLRHHGANSHRCVTFLVSTSIYKCFSSVDAPDRSHGLAPHVKTKILELMECGIHKKAEILQRLKVAQVL